ncbi:uncharacterized protein LOC120774646 [Bactrocera tryoni]|uniref:uncharacterized protein LOC120774646 n=1 Tax=Bactrocera tryoni TaxID=59916 RepID=UPI001A99353F|nr:uncharacterized protein LOC120774646 [Bactrocera tryoni]
MSEGSVKTTPKDDLGRHENVCETMLSDYQDVSWNYAYDPETDIQLSEYRGKGEPKKPLQNRPKIKIMLTVFFDYRGIVYSEYLPTDKTVNKEHYLSVMCHLRKAIRKKVPKLWAESYWFLHRRILH